MTDQEFVDLATPDPEPAAPWRSQTIGEIGAALARAQGDFDAAHKDAKSHYGTYADLKAVIKAVQEPLAKNEIAYYQALSANGASVTCDTVLIHSSGEWLRSSLTLTADDRSPQKQGSAATYARRYGLQAAVGLAAEDDDADSAQGVTTPDPVAQAKTFAKTAKAKSGTITEKQAKRLFAIAKSKGRDMDDVKDYLQGTWGISKSEEIKKTNYDEIIAWIEAPDEPPPVEDVLVI